MTTPSRRTPLFRLVPCLLAGLLVASPLLAGVVSEVPRGVTRLGLLLCPDGDCSDEAYWIGTQTDHSESSIVLIDTILDRDDRTAAGRQVLRLRFEQAITRAQGHVTAERPVAAQTALSEADHTLRRWSGSPSTQALFSHAYLHGAAAQLSGTDPLPHFRQAAAVAWTQEVTPPLAGLEVGAWRQALAETAEGPTATLVLGGVSNPQGRYALNGVDLGPGELEVQVLPGAHRVTCSESGSERAWKRDLEVRPGTTTHVGCELTPADDPLWIEARLLEAAGTNEAPVEVLERLADWCRWNNIHRLTLLRVTGRPGHWVLDEAVFEPHLRRFL